MMKEIKTLNYDYGTYIGEVTMGDVENGEGIFTWNDGREYRGSFVDGLMEGYGEHTHPSGDTYKGEWKDGKFHGTGTYSWTNGNVYCGEWCNGMENGKGVGTFKETGERYEGEYVDRKRCGHGILTIPGQYTYEGEFYDNRPNGLGEMILDRGDRYVGSFKNSLPDGDGVMYYDNGSQYEGEMKNGKRDGYGVLTQHNGCILKGDWKEGKADGEFEHWCVDGNYAKEHWVDGELCDTVTSCESLMNELADDTLATDKVDNLENDMFKKGYFSEIEIDGEPSDRINDVYENNDSEENIFSNEIHEHLENKWDEN